MASSRLPFGAAATLSDMRARSPFGVAESLSDTQARSPTQTVRTRLGGAEHKDVSLDILKHRFFVLGLQIGTATQMFFMAVLVMCMSYDSRTGAIYQLTTGYYPLFRGLFLICFFGACYGSVLYSFRRHAIEYGPIIGVGHEHNYHFVIRLSTILLSIVFMMFILYVFTLTADLPYFTETQHIWPALALVGILLRFFWPTDLIEFRGREQRYSFLNAIFAVLMSPFSEATFSRTFVADVLTSMPKIFADLQFTACMYMTGEAFLDKSSRAGGCTDGNAAYKACHIAFSILPFWVRLMQSIRGLVDTRKLKHVANGFKYCMSITVVALSFMPTSDFYHYWKAVSIISSCFAYFWDVCMDWGLGPARIRRALHGSVLGGPSEQCLLRPKRHYRTVWYYFAMITNAVARFGWAIYISPGQKVLRQHFVLLLGCVELLRRTQWSLFRLEWAVICSQPSSELEPPSMQLIQHTE